MEARRSWFPVVAFLIMAIATQTGANPVVEVPYPTRLSIMDSCNYDAGGPEQSVFPIVGRYPPRLRE